HRANAHHPARPAACFRVAAVAEYLDSAQLAYVAQVDGGSGTRAAEFPLRQQRMAARQECGVLVEAGHLQCLGDGCRAQVVEADRDHRAPPGALPPVAAWRIAVRTCSACSGMSRCVTPSGARASRTALTMAGGAPMAPASPMPLMPSGVNGDGVTVCSVSR